LVSTYNFEVDRERYSYHNTPSIGTESGSKNLKSHSYSVVVAGFETGSLVPKTAIFTIMLGFLSVH
jgi:hypothetical protein